MKKTGKRTEKIRFLPTESILPNPLLAGRKMRDPALESLADSIDRYGILQPLLVQRSPWGYRLLCGSRRLRAAKSLGMSHVPCRVLQLSDREAGEITLAENLNRLPLAPFEEAVTADHLLKTYPYRLGELADRVGENPSALSAKLRLLRFSPEERKLLFRYGLSTEYAEPLLHLRETELRLYAIRQIGENRLPLKDTRELCLSLALHPEEFMPPVRPHPQPRPAKVRRFVVKDFGFFTNSLDRAIGSLRQAGFEVETEKIDGGDYLSYSIRIPKFKMG